MLTGIKTVVPTGKSIKGRTSDDAKPCLVQGACTTFVAQPADFEPTVALGTDWPTLSWAPMQQRQFDSPDIGHKTADFSTGRGGGAEDSGQAQTSDDMPI